MAEIPLQEYVTTIQGLLHGGAADEAAYHSRHLLSRYPKYTPAFRLLGRALLLKGQYDEAEAAFRRVLSVEPDDRDSHLSLSEVYDQRHRGDEALWHAERALELDVHDQAANEAVNALYRRYRSQDRGRMGLTAVTLARQALLNRDYGQAVQTLRSALERQPDRVDLKLLLAEVLWASGDHISGAEAASDVLDVLPDCFRANQILSQLWLENGRPSDARPFLNRLEALDPYAALALVTNQPAAADAFTLDPLDYQRSAQSDLTQVEPDWLQGLPSAPPVPSEGPAADSDWVSGMLATAEAPAVPPDDAASFAETALTPLAEAEELPDIAALTATPDLGEDLFGELDDLEAPAIEPEPPAPDPFVGASPAEDIATDLDLMFGEGQETPALGVSPFDFSEPTPAPPVTGATAPLPALDPAAPQRMAPAEDALAWLRDSGVELVEDEAPGLEPDMGGEFPTEDSTDNLDPMAWLNSYDTVLAAVNPDAPLPDGTDTGAAEDWQQEPWDPDAVELDAFTGETPAAEATPDDELAVPSSGTSTLRGLTSRLGDPTVTPPPAPEIPPALTDDAVLDEWLSQFDAPAAAEAGQANPDWLTNLGVTMSNPPESTPVEPGNGNELPTPADESNDWLAEFAPEGVSQPSEEPALPEEDWLTQLEGAPGAAAEAAEEPMADWLAEAAPEGLADAFTGEPAPEGAAAAGEFDWLNTLTTPAGEPDDAVDEAVLAAQADVPDWLNALEAEALAAIDAGEAEVTPEAELAESLAAADDAAAELEALPFDETAEPAEPVEAAYEAAFDAEQAAGAVADQAAVEFAAAWEPEPAEPAAEVTDLALDLDAAAAAFVAAAEGEAEPAGEAAPAMETEFAAPAEPVAETEFSVEGEPIIENEAAAEVPAADWGEPETADLARIAPPTVGLEELEPAPAAPVAPDDWFADGELAAEAPVPGEGSLPAAGEDWYTDATLQAPAAEAEAAPEPAAESAEWQSELEAQAAVTQLGTDTVLMGGELTEPEEATAATEEALAEAEADAGVPLAAAGLAGAGALALGALEFGADEEPETAAAEAAVEATAEDWLAEEWPEEAESPALAFDELDELPDVEIAEETHIAPAANAPDWLNAMVPGLDMDYGAAEDEPIETGFEEPVGGALDETLGARSEYAWVIDLVDQEEYATAPALVEAEGELDAAAAAGPRYVFSRLPAWFRASGDDDDFADWPGDDSSLPAWQN